MRDKLVDEDEVLYRQVHPNFFDGEQPSSQAFAPTPKDNGKLSVDRSSLTTAGKAYELYTKNYKSIGVWGLTVGEFGAEELDCFSDKLEDNSAHAVADYSPYSLNQQKNKAKRLKRRAIQRGLLHPPR